jgi:hypothetical protein
VGSSGVCGKKVVGGKAGREGSIGTGGVQVVGGKAGMEGSIGTGVCKWWAGRQEGKEA